MIDLCVCLKKQELFLSHNATWGYAYFLMLLKKGFAQNCSRASSQACCNF